MTLPESIELEAGATAALTVALIPENTTETALIWNSSDPSVASVEDGTVTGRRHGSATISVKAANGATASCQVTVTPPVILPEQLTLSLTALEINARESAMITAAVLPADCTNPAVSWTSSDESVAIVRDGIVYGISEGSAVITVSTHNALTAQATVEVYQPTDIDSIRLSNPYPSQYEEVAIITAPLGGTDQMEFQYTVLFGGEQLVQTDWIADSEYRFSTDSIGEYTVQAQARDLSLGESSPILSESAQVWYMQSAHPYEAYTSKSWSYTVDGAEYIALTFSDQTELRKNSAFLEITGNDGELFSYTGTELAGQTIALRGDTANLSLSNGSSYTSYGFEVTDIRAITEKEHFELTYTPLKVTSFALDTTYPSIGEVITANAQIACSGDTLCQYTLSIDGEQIAQTDWIEDRSYSFTADRAGSYTVSLQVHDLYKDEYSDTISRSVTVLHAQSQHPYAANTDRTWTVSLADADYMKATFSSSCALSSGDTVIITDAAGRETQYAGGMLKSRQLAFAGSSFTIRLISDDTPGGYGFAVTGLSSMTAEEYDAWYEDLNLKSVSLSNAHISQGEAFTATAECIGSGEIAYQYTLALGDAVIEQSEWTGDVRYSFLPAEPGDYTLSVQAHDLTRDVLSESVSAECSMRLLQSAHPYANRTDKTWSYSVEGAEYLAITFSDDTAFYNSYDYIIITDGAGKQTSYTGTALQGAVIGLQGGSFTIRLTTNGSGTAYGFAVTDVRSIDQKEYAVLTTTPPTLQSISFNPTEPAVYTQTTISPVVADGSGMFEYLFVITQDGTEILRSEWQQEPSFQFTPEAFATYAVSVQVRDTLLDVLTDALTAEFTAGLPQSEHPYANRTDQAWTCSLPEEAIGVAITFDESFSFERGFDYLTITDEAGDSSRYTGTALAGQTVYLNGGSFTLRLTSDSIVTDYGFAITEIRPLTQEEYDDLYYVPAVIESLTLSTTSPSRAEPFTVTPEITSSAEQLAVQYTVLRGEDVVLQTEWLENGPAELTVSESGAFTLQAQAKDLDRDRLGDIFSMDLPVCILQSEHPYADNTDQSWTYSDENAQYLAVTFDSSTATEDYCDYIYITDGYGKTWSYSGTELKGKTIGLRGGEFIIRLTSDGSFRTYGFGITEITAISEDTYYSEYFTPVRMDSLYVSSHDPSLGDTVTITAYAEYGLEEYEYRMIAALDGEVCLETPWQSEDTFDMLIEYVGEYEFTVEVRDVLHGDTDSTTQADISSAIAQTAHSYFMDPDQKWYLEVDGADYISVEFDENFELLEEDSLLITDAEGTARRYAGTDLAGVRLALRGSICRIELITPYDDPDFTSGYYGFRVTDLKAITQEEYLALDTITISAITLSPAAASLGDEITVSVDAVYSTADLEYRYSMLKGGVVLAQSEWTDEAAHTFTPDAIGEYEFTVDARSAKDSSVQVSKSCSTDVKLIQSEHPYADNMDQTWTYSIPGAEYLMITFSENTFVEWDYDFITLTGTDGKKLIYTGSELAGKTVYTVGDSVSITLTSDASYSEYGFVVEEIRAATAEEYEALPDSELEIVALRAVDYAAFVGKTGTVSAIVKGATDQTEYQFTVVLDDEAYLTTPWQKESSLDILFEESGEYKITVACRDGDTLIEYDGAVYIDVMYLFAYANMEAGEEICLSYSEPGADALQLLFTDYTELWPGCSVTITDAFGINQTFHNYELMGEAIGVRGDSFTLTISCTKNGYVDLAIRSIVPITIEEYEDMYQKPLTVNSLTISNTAPSLNDTAEIIALANGGSGSVNYRFTVSCDGEQLSQTGWLTQNRHSITFDRTGSYTVSVEVKDPTSESTASASKSSSVQVYPIQSLHPYAANTDRTWTWNAQPGQPLWVTFSDSTLFERGFDSLIITDELGTVGSYTGSELAGAEIAVTGSFTLRLTSDHSGNAFGFIVTGVRSRTAAEFEITEDGVLTGYNGSDASVAIPDSVTAIAASAFADKDSVTRIAIHDGVTYIEPDAFPEGTVLAVQKNLYVLLYAEQNGCACDYSGSLLKLPTALTHIEEAAFESTAAACIRLPESTAEIDSRAFADAPGLFMVYIPGSAAEIADDAFTGSEQAIILCTRGSSAHSFAEAQNMKCILLD